MLFIDDGDARGVGTAHPLASLWDNGADAIATLRHEMEVRRIGLKHFGLNSIPPGSRCRRSKRSCCRSICITAISSMAAAKSVGGLYFTYAVKTANGPSPAKFREIVPAARQREALKAILDTIKVEELAIPQHITRSDPAGGDGL